MYNLYSKWLIDDPEPPPHQEGGDDQYPYLAWTCRPILIWRGQGGLYHPKSILCVLYIHHQSIPKTDPSKSPKYHIFQ